MGLEPFEKEQRLDEAVVAPLVAEYYDWLSGNGGTSSDDLLAISLTPSQRKLLLARMDDVTVIYGLTADQRKTHDKFKRRLEEQDPPTQ